MREDGGFTTTIEPALDVPAAGSGGGDGGDGGDGDSVSEEILAAYGRQIESHLLRAPEQFSLWYSAADSPGAPG